MTNVTTIDSQLAQRAAYILHLNTGTKFVPCTKLTEELLRAWGRSDTCVRGCTQRQQRLMIEEARKVIRKLYNQSQLVNICWAIHVGAADRCGLDLWREGDSVDTTEFDSCTLTIGLHRVARARRNELERLEREHGASWDSKLVVASERISQLNSLMEQLEHRNRTDMADALFELRRGYSELERVRADEKNGNPRVAAGQLRRAIRKADDLIHAAPVCVPAADRAVSPRVAGDLLVGDRFRFINDMTKYAGVCELVRIDPCTYRRVVHGVGRHEWIQVDTRAQIVKL